MIALIHAGYLFIARSGKMLRGSGKRRWFISSSASVEYPIGASPFGGNEVSSCKCKCMLQPPFSSCSNEPRRAIRSPADTLPTGCRSSAR